MDCWRRPRSLRRAAGACCTAGAGAAGCGGRWWCRAGRLRGERRPRRPRSAPPCGTWFERASGLGSQILPLRGPGGQSAQLTRSKRRLDARQAVLLPARRPAASSDFILLRSGVKKLVRTLAPDGNYHLTKLGKAFFRKYTEWLAHVPVRIRGRRRNGRGYERLDYLPVTSLNVGLQRQNDGLSEGQVARNVQQAVLQKLGRSSEDDAIMELSEEVYYLDGAREWTLSSQTTQHVDNRTLVETSLRQPLGALRKVSYQLFKGRRDPGLGVRAAGRQALRGPAAGGAAAAGRSGASRRASSASGSS